MIDDLQTQLDVLTQSIALKTWQQHCEATSRSDEKEYMGIKLEFNNSFIRYFKLQHYDFIRLETEKPNILKIYFVEQIIEPKPNDMYFILRTFRGGKRASLKKFINQWLGKLGKKEEDLLPSRQRCPLYVKEPTPHWIYYIRFKLY